MTHSIPLTTFRPARREADIVERLGIALRRYRVYNGTYAELSRMTDRELEDIGFLRADIRDIARRAAAAV